MAFKNFKSNNPFTPSLMLILFLIAALTMSFVARKNPQAAPAPTSNKAYGVRSFPLAARFNEASDTTIPKEALVWKFGGKSGYLTSQNRYQDNTGYNLYCETNQKFLASKKQLFGLNVGFFDNEKVHSVHFRTKDKKQRKIRTGDLVALAIGGREPFLYYKHKPLGISCARSEEPRYEWQIISASGKRGELIKTGSSYAIVNVKVKSHPDFLVYMKRIVGQANIGWTSSPDQLRDALGDLKILGGANRKQ